MPTSSTRLGKLANLASRFRSAIEVAPPSTLGISFENYPRGSCGDATPLLGTFLAEAGEGLFDYMLGDRARPDGGRQSHAWLQQGSLTVDITADQFPDVSEPVIVADQPTRFHRTFDARAEHVADFRIYDPQTVARLSMVYARIKESLAAG